MALFGDLARRLAIANPAIQDPLEGQGVVLIDEIELHMHVSWQRNMMICENAQWQVPRVQLHDSILSETIL